MGIKQSNAGFTVVEIILVVVAMCALIGVGVVGYAAIQRADQAKESDTEKVVQQDARGREFFEFSDLDMKFEKTDSNKGMSFKASKDANAIYYVYDSKLNTLAEKCYPGEDREVSFSSIVRNEGYTGGSANSVVAKQFDTFNITLQNVADIQPCADTAHQEDFAQRVTNLQNQLEYSIRGAEKL